MKRIITLIITVAMVMAMSVAAFAENGFVSSPSNNKAPVLAGVEFETAEGETEEGEITGGNIGEGSNIFNGSLIITAYSDRGELGTEKEEDIEKAYDTIVSTPNLGDLCEALIEVAKEKRIPVENLAVRDLFDISFIPGEDGKIPSIYKIKLTAEEFENFAALLHFKNGEWELVENAAIFEEEETGEKYVSFSVDDLSPFAIVVDTGATVSTEPEQGFNWLWVLLAVAAGGSGYTYTNNKKKKA